MSFTRGLLYILLMKIRYKTRKKISIFSVYLAVHVSTVPFMIKSNHFITIFSEKYLFARIIYVIAWCELLYILIRKRNTKHLKFRCLLIDVCLVWGRGRVYYYLLFFLDSVALFLSDLLYWVWLYVTNENYIMHE